MLIKSRFLDNCILVFIVLSTYNPTLGLEDTGIGIRPEDLPRIFERGFTGYNGRLDQKSTGIGLYLCRQILTHLNIAIRVESEEGAGTKIVLGIPLAAERIRD